MLHSITLQDFKSYRKATLPLAPLTMLIGANASGKSNAIEGLRLLSWLAQGNRLTSIQNFVRESEQIVRGRIQDLAYSQSGQFSFSCRSIDPRTSTTSQELMISLSIGSDDLLHVAAERLDDSSAGTSMPLYEVVSEPRKVGNDLTVSYNNFRRGGKKPRIVCSDQCAVFTQLDNPSRFDKSHTDSHKHIPVATERFRSWLSNILFLDPVPVQMRDYGFQNERSMKRDGSNLSGVLYNLWGGREENPTTKQQENRETILNFIRSLPEQNIASVKFLDTPRKEVMLQLVETFGGKELDYDATLLSDGTLRVLAIAAAMLTAPEGGLVVIEEIDNGVHPSRARQLLQQIAMLAEKRHLRVLLSSHNPALLDAIPTSAVPDVVFCYRDLKDGSSCLVRLEDIPDYPELIAQGSVGQLMTSGFLDSFVKNHPGPDERKKKAMEWLERFRKEVEETHE
ncbi:MAG: AAA family ATPase [Magnetococcales bacterium]|nr:AAA family ATPase [Magnetococcales bacterium]